MDDLTRIKRQSKRIGHLEDAVEVLLDQNAGLIAAIQIIAKRLGSNLGADPVCAAMCGPAMRPRPLCDTQIDSLPDGVPGFYKVSLNSLSQVDRDIYDRLTKSFSNLRRLKKERSSPLIAPGGHAPGTDIPTRF